MSVELTPLMGTLTGAGDQFEVFPVGARACLLLSAGTGRVFGPFIDGVDRSGWVPTKASGSGDPNQRTQSVDDWNAGGERLWISPELDHFVQDRRRFWETYGVFRIAGHSPGAIKCPGYDLSNTGRRGAPMFAPIGAS